MPCSLTPVEVEEKSDPSKTRGGEIITVVIQSTKTTTTIPHNGSVAIQPLTLFILYSWFIFEFTTLAINRCTAVTLLLWETKGEVRMDAAPAPPLLDSVSCNWLCIYSSIMSVAAPDPLA